MTEDEIREIFEEAVVETSARAASVSLIVKPADDWIILLDTSNGDMAIQVPERPDSTHESIRNVIIRELKRLF